MESIMKNQFSVMFVIRNNKYEKNNNKASTRS